MCVDRLDIYDFNDLFQLSALSKDGDDTFSKKRKREGYVKSFPYNVVEKRKCEIYLQICRYNSFQNVTL